jgi:RHS repeat-associated protein
MYIYNPFGETIEEGGTFANAFRFTGQWFDDKIGPYYLRAWTYVPHLGWKY